MLFRRCSTEAACTPRLHATSLKQPALQGYMQLHWSSLHSKATCNFTEAACTPRLHVSRHINVCYLHAFCTYLCVHACMYICIYIYVYVYIYIYIRMYACLDVLWYARIVSICVYVDVYLYANFGILPLFLILILIYTLFESIVAQGHRHSAQTYSERMHQVPELLSIYMCIHTYIHAFMYAYTTCMPSLFLSCNISGAV